MRAIAEQRDREAFRRLFEHYAPRLKGMFVRMGHQAQVAEDLVQEVMLSVWRRADGYRPERAAVSTWLFTITKNRGIDQHRRRMRRAAMHDAMPDHGNGTIAQEAAEPGRHLRQGVTMVGRPIPAIPGALDQHDACVVLRAHRRP
jgi:RNA polymerase sigma-70 factor (ECF subfamily)